MRPLINDSLRALPVKPEGVEFSQQVFYRSRIAVPPDGERGLGCGVGVHIGHYIIGLILQLNDQVSRTDHVSPTHYHFFYLIIFQVHLYRSCGGKGISLQE